jgi:hypothetical protein
MKCPLRRLQHFGKQINIITGRTEKWQTTGMRGTGNILMSQGNIRDWRAEHDQICDVDVKCDTDGGGGEDVKGETGTVSKSFRKHLSNTPGGHEIKDLA